MYLSNDVTCTILWTMLNMEKSERQNLSSCGHPEKSPNPQNIPTVTLITVSNVNRSVRDAVKVTIWSNVPLTMAFHTDNLTQNLTPEWHLSFWMVCMWGREETWSNLMNRSAIYCSSKYSLWNNFIFFLLFTWDNAFFPLYFRIYTHQPHYNHLSNIM